MRSAAEQFDRRIVIAAGVSILIHALIFSLPVRKTPSMLAPGPMVSAPMDVRILPVEPSKAESQPAPAEPVQPAPSMPQPFPVPRKRTPQRVPPMPVTPAPVASLPLPVPAPAPPPVDMMAAVEARRAQRRAAEAAAARGPPVSTKPLEDAATRNLATLSGREGVGGVFQILRIGTRTGEFAFNGWRPDARSQWREVIEVDAGLNGNIELALVRRMIELIRTHYTGDFNWESHRLQRVVTLSARQEDNEGLEDFLMREFFGQPLINPRR